MYVDENGRKFIIDTNGERVYVKKDKNGNEYIEYADGRKQRLPHNLAQEPLLMTKDGKVFEKDKETGEIVEIEIDELGRKFKIKDGKRVEVDGPGPNFCV